MKVCLTLRLDGEKKVYEKIETLQGLRVLVAAEAGMDDFLTKPLKIEEVLKLISSVL